MKFFNAKVFSIFFFSLLNIFLLISLATFNINDSSFVYDPLNYKCNNLYGYIGSYVAGFILYFFGSSFFVVFLPSFLILLYMLNYFNLKKEFDRLFFSFLFIFVFSAFLSFHQLEFYNGIYPGGTVGYLINNFLNKIFIPIHANMFLWIILSVNLILIEQFYLLKYFLPIINSVKALPFGQAFNIILALILKILNFLQIRLIKLIDFITKEEESDIEIQKIFEDPFWFVEDYETNNIVFEKPEIKTDVEPDKVVNTFNPIKFVKESISKITRNQIKDSRYILPPTHFFKVNEIVSALVNQENEDQAKILEDKLTHFGVQGRVISITHGPVVTLFEYQPAIDTKISNILAREDDLALALQALSLRIIAPIPGRSVVGFEVAHKNRQSVFFGDLINSSDFKNFIGDLPLILGKDTLGQNVIIDLVSTPHLLVAGSTGSGKSVGLNCMLMSLICSKTPDDLKLILIDPKRLEFALYADIPHLLFPIITESTRAIMVLKWAVKTMEERYVAMAKAGVKNITQYRELNDSSNEPMPFIVIIIDELADLIMTGAKDVEYSIARLAQMARAAGIHLILATQRPSVDVITGLIKVNFPSRIAYKVTSKVDSRTILDTMGAEKLLGKGDMLYLDNKGAINRVHGAYIRDEEILSIVEYSKLQREVEYEEFEVAKSLPGEEFEDDIYEDILKYIKDKDEISISLLQRVFRIGYNRSARIIDKLEFDGFITPTDGSKMRKVVKDT